MPNKISGWLAVTLLLTIFSLAEAQQPNVYRVGVILQGGEWNTVVDGLRAGLKELGLEEKKHFIMEIRDTKGDLNAVDEAAKKLERDKVNVLYTIATSVTIRARQATGDTPIVFCAGTDPVSLGLVDSFSKPGGRLSGVHFLATDLTAKRLELLKDILPNLRRAVTFYDPNNPVAREALRLAQEEARRLRVDLIDRQVGSVREFQVGMQTIKLNEFDALLLIADAMVLSQPQLIVELTRTKKMATMFWEENSVVKGGLASYGVSYHEAGQLSAKYIQRVLTGTRPQDLPVETIRKLNFVVNLKTAKEIGLTLPPNVLARADRVIK